jgi:hypothetical protein
VATRALLTWAVRCDEYFYCVQPSIVRDEYRFVRRAYSFVGFGLTNRSRRMLFVATTLCIIRSCFEAARTRNEARMMFTVAVVVCVLRVAFALSLSRCPSARDLRRWVAEALSRCPGNKRTCRSSNFASRSQWVGWMMVGLK